MPSPSNEDRICAMFDSFSKTVSKNFVRNLDRAEGNRDKHFAEEPADYILELLGHEDKYPSESFVLYAGEIKRKYAKALKKNKRGVAFTCLIILLHISAGRRLSVEKVKCPNPKCGRHILDIEEMPSGETVLEMKCRRCGKVVQVGFGPRMVHKKNRRQG